MLVAVHVVTVAVVPLNVTVPVDPKFVPVIVTGVPTVPAVTDRLVIVGPWVTVSVKFCWAAVPIPLLAVKVRGYVPLVPAAGVPLSVPVPLALAANVTPLGSAPDSVREGAGVPVVVTVNVAATPTANVVLFALVIAGAWSTVNVKDCEAGVPTPLLAVNVNK
jgi:hypothetical protein